MLVPEGYYVWQRIEAAYWLMCMAIELKVSIGPLCCFSSDLKSFKV